MNSSSNVTQRKNLTKTSLADQQDHSLESGPANQAEGVELKRTPSKLMFMATRRRSSMLADAKKNSVKCNMPCFDEEDDGNFMLHAQVFAKV
jgi:hypothetical protein